MVGQKPFRFRISFRVKGAIFGLDECPILPGVYFLSGILNCQNFRQGSFHQLFEDLVYVCGLFCGSFEMKHLVALSITLSCNSLQIRDENRE